MRVVITGAAGFVASAVADALVDDPHCLGRAITDLVLADLTHGQTKGRWITGDLADPTHIAALIADPVDVFFHMASVPGAMADAHPDLGHAVNLDASLSLLDGLARQQLKPRVVFASSIAVMGALGTDTVSAAQPAAPVSSYGRHKHMVETDIASLSCRGDIDGVSLRLPGIVARPPAAAGFGSAFMSDLFHAAAAGRAYTCPVSPDATAWWMSRQTAVTNVLHAARMDSDAIGPDRMVLLPALFASINDLVAGLTDRFGPAAVSRMTFAPDDTIVARFGRFPDINNRTALDLGFAMDTDIATLIANVGTLAGDMRDSDPIAPQARSGEFQRPT